MADIFKLAERMMSMDDRTWRRHANPWSGLTRFTCLPLIVLAIWSRVWIGWWALAALAAALLWTWANPRAFPEPAHLDHWMSRGVMGERVFLERRDRVAQHHLTAAKLLTGVSAAGAAVMVWGLWDLHVWATISGMIVAMLGKVWFVDRMAWIWADWRAEGGAPW